MGVILFLIGGGITVVGAIGILAFPLMGVPVTVIGVMVLLAGLAKMSGKNKVTIVQQTPGSDDPTKICPQCAETIKEQAKICRYCSFSFDKDLSET